MKLPQYLKFCFWATLVTIIVLILLGLYNWLVYHNTYSFFWLALIGIPMLIFNFFIYRRNRKTLTNKRTS